MSTPLIYSLILSSAFSWGNFIYHLIYVFKVQIVGKKKKGHDINLFRLILLTNFIFNILDKAVTFLLLILKLSSPKFTPKANIIAAPFMISGLLCFNNFNITLILMLVGILNAIKFTKAKNNERLEQNELWENEYLLVWILALMMMGNMILFGFNAYFEIDHLDHSRVSNVLEWVSKVVNLI